MNNKRSKKHQKNSTDFDYQKLSEDEMLLNNVLTTNEKDISKNEIIDQMIKGNISDLVKNQLNNNKRNDLQESIYTSNKKNTSPWFAEYKKQRITITKDKIRAYLRNYKDLEKLIKYRKEKIEKGEIESESQELNLIDFENYDFLEESVNKLF